ADPTLFHVRGEHAHAWPEVYLAGAGWVSFEPTPGRGQPFAEGYTGVPVAQAATADPGAATTAPPTTNAGSVPTIPDASSRPVRDEVSTAAGKGARPPSSQGLVARFVGRPLRRAAPIVGTVLLAYLLLVPTALVVRRRLRRRRATTPAARIGLAWAEVAESAGLIGYREDPSDTFQERADRLAAVLPGGASAEQAAQLADHNERAVYSAEGADDLDAEAAEAAGAALGTTALAAAPILTRVGRWLDARPWFRDWQRARRRQRRITTTVRADLEAERELVGSGDRL
ncbi:MAG: hypothetical protein ABIY48_09610, partial [Acidimicrobiales bacterium]